MANILNQFNSNRKFTFEASDDMPFVSLETLYTTNGPDMVYTLRALYINKKGKYGDAPVAITDTAFVNLPKHLCSTVEDMISSREVVNAVNAGQAFFKVERYVPRNYPNRIAYSVIWLDAE